MHYHKMHHFRFDDVKPRMMHLYGITLWCFFSQGGSPNSSGVLLEIQTLLVVSNVVVCIEINFTVWDQFYSTVCCTHKTRTTNNYQGPAGCLAHVFVLQITLSADENVCLWGRVGRCVVGSFKDLHFRCSHRKVNYCASVVPHSWSKDSCFF